MASNSSKQQTSALVSRYRAALTALSTRTRTPLPALITSFAILHEATAILPLVGVFYACRTFSVGEGVVGYVRRQISTDVESEKPSSVGAKWMRETTEKWMQEGEQWTERVGRRYGIWGFQFQKRGETSPSSTSSPISTSASTTSPTGPGNHINVNVAGDVANALVAYCATKALLPVRVGLSLYFSPAFARGIVLPVSHSVGSVFRRGK